ncbi:MAG TPA: ABC transporter transmembrane domain-containing protein, partial [Vicinamibacterales bacterium]|nr:ABC transporter transmembrane domain-containing protein [Vicinamibacterales bacterium]
MSPFRRLLSYATRYRRKFAIGVVTVVASRGGYLLAPAVTGKAIDDLTRGVTLDKFVRWGLLLLAIGLFGGVFRFLMRRILTGVSRDIEYDMRNEFFAHLETLPAVYFQANRTGDLMSRATNDLNAVRMMIGPAVMYLSDTILAAVVALGAMIAIDWRLTIVALIPMPCVSISVKYFGTAIHKRFEQIQAQLSDLSAVAQEAFAGVRVVRAYRQETDQLRRFASSNEEFVRRNRRLIAVQGFFFPSMTFFLGLGALVVVWYGSRQVIGRHMTVGQFVAFFGYFTMLGWPMIAFGWVTNMIQRGMASWKRMLEVLETEPAIADRSPVGGPERPAPQITGRPGLSGPAMPSGPGLSGPAAIRGDIEFRDLTFAFGDRAVLHHVSARIRVGQTVALVGPTGSGKSTLISLLARIYDPPPGTVFVDGIDVRDLRLASLRGAIGFVPQEPFLFSDSLAANVAFGLDAQIAALQEQESSRATLSGSPDREAAILHAAAVSRLDKDVVDFPKGYDTMVGERGITLSGGQKQRAALARAIAIDPKILILDDALSAVDTYTE